MVDSWDATWAVPIDRFNIEYPSDTIVYDHIDKAVYEVRTNGERHHLSEEEKRMSYDEFKKRGIR